RAVEGLILAVRTGVIVHVEWVAVPPAELLADWIMLFQGLNGGLFIVQGCLDASSAALRLLGSDGSADDGVRARTVMKRTADQVADGLVRRRIGCFLNHGAKRHFGNEGLEAPLRIEEAMVTGQCLGAGPISRLIANDFARELRILLDWSVHQPGLRPSGLNMGFWGGPVTISG